MTLLKGDIRSSMLLRGVVTSDVSGQPIGPIFKGQAENCLTPEDGTDMLLGCVGKYLQIYGVQHRRRAKTSAEKNTPSFQVRK